MTNLAEAYVPDSHSIVWRFEDSSRLTATVHALFDAVERDEVRFVIPTIVLGELLSLSERRMPNLPLQAILEELGSLTSVTFAPLDMQVFTQMRRLPALSSYTTE